MNKGTYGFPLPPNAPTRVAPPEWRNYKLITATTSTEVVPQNVYQMLVMVWGGGGGGGAGNNGNGSSGQGGGAGGFAAGIIDVVPGQRLPKITIGSGGLGAPSTASYGAPGGTTSFGNLLTATGGAGGAYDAGAGGAGGTGAVSSSLRCAVAYKGGAGGAGWGPGQGGALLGGGGAPGWLGGPGVAGFGGSATSAGVGASLALVTSSTFGPLSILDLVNGRLNPVWTGSVPIGLGGTNSATETALAYFAGMGGNTSMTNTLKNHFGGGGGGAGYNNGGGTGGDGVVILAWTEGY